MGQTPLYARSGHPGRRNVTRNESKSFRSLETFPIEESNCGEADAECVENRRADGARDRGGIPFAAATLRVSKIAPRFATDVWL